MHDSAPRNGPRSSRRSSARTNPFLQLAFRLGPRLYDLGLGGLFGHRFLVLTHRGRRSGTLYRSMLEVAEYDPQLNESRVISGWGSEADWFRNLQASPAVEIQTAGLRYVPIQRLLTADEVYALVCRYLRRNPWAGPAIKGLFRLRFDGSAADNGDQRQRLRGVAFRPAG